jgi:hypothetical protein
LFNCETLNLNFLYAWLMSSEKYHKVPPADPVTGGPLFISELTGLESGITIRGRFEIPMYSRLDEEQQRFLETFLRCRGMLNSVERELGISYPTVRARLDSLLVSLGFSAEREEPTAKEKGADQKQRILDQLERGEISAEEAKTQLGVSK